MKVRTFSLLLVACSGCAVGPRLDTPAADSAAMDPLGAPMPRTLAVDSPTRKTTELLAAVGADALEGLKPMNMHAMEGMGHSTAPGVKAGGHGEAMDHAAMSATPAKPKPDQMKAPSMPEMDHSKMHGVRMERSGALPDKKPDALPPKGASPQPPAATATAEEMKRTSEEMKKASEEMKAKAEALGKSREAKPPAPPRSSETGDHSHHKP